MPNRILFLPTADDGLTVNNRDLNTNTFSKALNKFRVQEYEDDIILLEEVLRQLRTSHLISLDLTKIRTEDSLPLDLYIQKKYNSLKTPDLGFKPQNIEEVTRLLEDILKSVLIKLEKENSIFSKRPSTIVRNTVLKLLSIRTKLEIVLRGLTKLRLIYKPKVNLVKILAEDFYFDFCVNNNSSLFQNFSELSFYTLLKIFKENILERAKRIVDLINILIKQKQLKGGLRWRMGQGRSYLRQAQEVAKQKEAQILFNNYREFIRILSGIQDNYRDLFTQEYCSIDNLKFNELFLEDNHDNKKQLFNFILKLEKAIERFKLINDFIHELLNTKNRFKTLFFDLKEPYDDISKLIEVLTEIESFDQEIIYFRTHQDFLNYLKLRFINVQRKYELMRQHSRAFAKDDTSTYMSKLVSLRETQITNLAEPAPRHVNVNYMREEEMNQLNTVTKEMLMKERIEKSLLKLGNTEWTPTVEDNNNNLESVGELPMFKPKPTKPIKLTNYQPKGSELSGGYKKSRKRVKNSKKKKHNFKKKNSIKSRKFKKNKKARVSGRSSKLRAGRR